MQGQRDQGDKPLHANCRQLQFCEYANASRLHSSCPQLRAEHMPHTTTNGMNERSPTLDWENSKAHSKKGMTAKEETIKRRDEIGEFKAAHPSDPDHRRVAQTAPSAAAAPAPCQTDPLRRSHPNRTGPQMTLRTLPAAPQSSCLHIHTRHHRQPQPSPAAKTTPHSLPRLPRLLPLLRRLLLQVQAHVQQGRWCKRCCCCWQAACCQTQRIRKSRGLGAPPLPPRASGVLSARASFQLTHSAAAAAAAAPVAHAAAAAGMLGVEGSQDPQACAAAHAPGPAERRKQWATSQGTAGQQRRKASLQRCRRYGAHALGCALAARAVPAAAPAAAAAAAAAGGGGHQQRLCRCHEMPCYHGVQQPGSLPQVSKGPAGALRKGVQLPMVPKKLPRSCHHW